MSKCVCGEAELGAAGTGTWPAPLDLAGSHHRADGPCYRIEDGASIARSPHASDCVCMECEDRRAGQHPDVELTGGQDGDTFGKELLRILELGRYTRSITLEADDHSGGVFMLATVTTQAYIDLEDRGREFVDVLRHYRLMALKPEEITE